MTSEVMKEQGSASVNICLKDGRVIVTHGDSGHVLFSSPVVAGTWEAIWLALNAGRIDEETSVS